MSLDNKNSGDKWFAFELNNILADLRQIVLNILKLNENRHWDYLSSDTGTSITAPEDANFGVVTTNEGDMILAREGKTSGATGTITGSWSGDTVTISSSKTIYFYT